MTEKRKSMADNARAAGWVFKEGVGWFFPEASKKPVTTQLKSRPSGRSKRRAKSGGA